MQALVETNNAKPHFTPQSRIIFPYKFMPSRQHRNTNLLQDADSKRQKKMGRRKIEMEMVQDTNTRQVTFSKRRTGLFKKASELATLCNAEVGIVVFSPGGKPFSYGKPSVDTVAERFMKDIEAEENKGKGRAKSKLQKMSDHLNMLTRKLEAEKKQGEMLERLIESAGDERFMKPVEEFSLDELMEYKTKLQEAHDKIIGKAIEMQASSLLMILSRDKTPTDEENED